LVDLIHSPRRKVRYTYRLTDISRLPGRTCATTPIMRIAIGIGRGKRSGKRETRKGGIRREKEKKRVQEITHPALISFIPWELVRRRNESMFRIDLTPFLYEPSFSLNDRQAEHMEMQLFSHPLRALRVSSQFQDWRTPVMEDQGQVPWDSSSLNLA
jgi:hypothetical protein